MLALPLGGKVALVTGAGRGIGREVALRLARDGAKIVAHYSASKQGAEEVVEEIISHGGDARAFGADVTSARQVGSLFQDIDSSFGALDIVVNCAGLSGGGALQDLDPEQAMRLFAVNTLGPLYVASEAAKRLGEGGRIINFGSTLADFPVAGAGVYSAAKSAIKSFTESWAKDLGSKGITVNTVIPGATSPGMFDRTPEPYRELFENASPFKRVGTATEIAAVVAFLASPEASWVSGAHIRANGAASA
ncbi:MAG: SDR family oxidoreductase [Novosphingobium sp.]|nr:SDR family oxidoreductase [Novosphingobium sp.]